MLTLHLKSTFHIVYRHLTQHWLKTTDLNWSFARHSPPYNGLSLKDTLYKLHLKCTDRHTHSHTRVRTRTHTHTATNKYLHL